MMSNSSDLLCNESILSNTSSVEGASGGGATSGIASSMALLQSPAPWQSLPHAAVDLALLQDCRVLENMLTMQLTMLPSDHYLRDLNSKIKPSMRKIVTSWMLELCDEQQCEDQVFLVAVNLLDRFLNTTPVNKSQLQLSACVCLLLASKLRQCTYLSVELLAFYTDHYVTMEEVRQWEILVVAKLRWDLCPVTPIDFVDVLLQQMPAVPDVRKIRKHASIFIALAATECEFICHRPSSIAGAAIVAAIQGLTHSSVSSMAPYIDTIAKMLQSPPQTLEPVLCALEESVKRASCPPNSNHSGGDAEGCGDISPKHREQYTKLREMMEPGVEMADSDGKETPVDVLDIPL